MDKQLLENRLMQRMTHLGIQVWSTTKVRTRRALARDLANYLKQFNEYKSTDKMVSSRKARTK